MYGRSLLFVIALVGGLAAQTTLAAVGRTPGSFDVSSTGAATYRIGIWTPPGPSGLTPQLGLTYNSSTGNGILGVGWSLSGLSTIARCNRNVAQDTITGGVGLTTEDRFCLDGNRLRLLPGSAGYGVAGSTYRTESDTFGTITAVDSAGGGPGHFELRSSDGHRYEYGAAGNSQLYAGTAATPYEWRLNKVTDASGNTYIITYSDGLASAISAAPATISWAPTGAGASTYLYTATFIYSESRTDKDWYSGYIAGNFVLDKRRLDRIEISSGGQVVRNYVMSYDTSPTTQRSRLTEVKECADTQATNCLAPTVIGYQAGVAGVSASSATATNGSVRSPWERYDFDGDNRDDLLMSGGVAFATTGGFTGIIPTSGGSAGHFVPGNRDGLLSTDASTYTSWNGTSFVSSSTGISEGYTYLADVNGDGLDDLVWYEQTGSASNRHGELHLRLNTTTAGATVPTFGAEQIGANFEVGSGTVSAEGQIVFGQTKQDYDGDGREDIVVQMQTELNTRVGFYQYYVYLQVFLARDNGFAAQPKQQVQVQQVINGHLTGSVSKYEPGEIRYLNLNNDRCTDRIVRTAISLSKCDGSPAETATLPSAPIAVLDWDGDGLSDFAVNNGGTIGIYRSTGVGVSAVESTSIPYQAGTWFAADMDGDGLEELLYQSPTAPYAISFYTKTGSGQTATSATGIPDLAITFTDGYGVRYQSNYTTTAISDYTSASNGGHDELEPLRSPLVIVNQVTSSDGTGDTYNKTYSYSGGRQHVDRPESATFEQRTETDIRTGLKRRTTYQQIFPFTGRVHQEELLKSNGVAIHTTTNNYQEYTYESGVDLSRHYPYIDNSAETLKDLNSEALISTTTNANTFDSTTGALTSELTTITESSAANGGQSNVVHFIETHYTLFNDFTNSCFGRPDTTTLKRSHTSTGGAAVTRTDRTVWDGAHCRPQQTLVEPGDTLWQVTTDFLYDGFGNVDLMTVTPAANQGQGVRVTDPEWDATGRFLQKVTNPEGEVTEFGWDASLGVRTSVTDANHLPTTSTLDGFGRVQREDRPDQTATDYVLEWCNTATCQGTDSWIRTQLTAIRRGTGNEEVSRAVTWLDMFDRETRTQSKVQSSGTTANLSNVRRTFNNLGLPALVSMPYLNGEAEYDTTFAYDKLGRPLLAHRQASEADLSDYDTGWSYNGLSTIISTPLNHQVTQRRSVLGEIVDVSDAAGTTHYDYDAFSNLAAVHSPNASTVTMGYSVRGLKTSLNDPNLGNRTYTYYPLGELKSQHDANGHTITFAYDAVSRPTSRVTSEGTTTEWEWGVGATLKDVGKLIRLESPGLKETYGYDDSARLQLRRIVSDGTYDYNYTYNSIGEVDTLTYPVSTSGYRLALQYEYDFGLLRQIVDANASGTVFWRANAMNASGQVTQRLLGNGVLTDFGVDRITGHVRSIKSGVGGGSALQNEAYLYDVRGNTTQRQNYKLGLTEDFYYDNLDRLETATVSGGGDATSLDMSYDSVGNVTSRSDVANGATWMYSNAKPNAVLQAGANTYGYDDNGNVATRNGYEIKWTTDNLPWEINGPGKKLTFSYGPSRERFRQIYNNGSTTEATEYIGGMLEKVTAGGVIDWRHYISVNGSMVAVLSRKSTGAIGTRYLLNDSQQSISEIVDASGTPYVSESFAPFGSRRDASDWDSDCNCTDLEKMSEVTRRGYTGHEMIGGVSMQLIHMNGRIYDSVIGRFMSADPMMSAPFEPQNLNRYSYVANNPLSFVDPSGFCRTGVGAVSNPNDLASIDYTFALCRDDIGPGDFAHGPIRSSSGGSPGGDGGRGGGRAPLSGVETVTVSAPKCWNADLSVSGSVQGIFGVGGGSAIGFSYGGDLLNSRLFFKFQANSLFGVGLFAGVGVSLEGGPGAVPAGLATSYGVHFEANRAAGPGWGGGYDYSGPGGYSAGGAHEAAPFGRLGIGAGYSFGSGMFTQSTIGLPSPAELINAAIDEINRSLSEASIPLSLQPIATPEC